MSVARASRSVCLTAAGVALAWTAAVVVSFAAYQRTVRKGVLDLALVEARAAFERNLAFRRWAAGHGGVYVPVTEATPPNPWLSVPERDITTPSGRRLTLVNPAYMVRQMYEQQLERGGTVARITSAHPVRPGNAPDPWEARALARFEAGEAEVVEVVQDPPRLRYIRRLLLEDRCLGCHGGGAARVGDLRGGISVTVPMAAYAAVADAQVLRIGGGHLAVWGLGIAAIVATTARARRRELERERERSEREALEQQLSHARRLEAIGRLAGGVAHDLNNLLSPILGNAGLALERDPPDELRQDLRDIHEAAERARVLTQQLLAFGRKQVLAVEPLDVADAVEAVAPMLRSLVGSAVELRVSVPRGLPRVCADRAQLGAALLNLAANARDAMPDGGLLQVTAEVVDLGEERASRDGIAPGIHVILSVSDTGAGMDDDVRERIFEPFFTTKESGNGLGLASAHGTVRQLGGAIEVESAPGKGSTFRVLLPAGGASPGASPSPATAPREVVPGSRETVLLVEDDEAVRRMAAQVLAGLNYRVLTAAGAEEALRIAEERGRELHALVSDVQMPRMDGRALHERLAALRPGLPTVFITGFAGEVLGPEDRLPPGAVVVHKPFTVAELGVALRRVLDG